MKKAKEKQNQIQFDNYTKEPVTLGPYTSHMYRNDPKHLGFLFARYKFVSKMLSSKSEVLEVGCGDATGSPLVAAQVKKLHCVDFEPLLMEDNRTRLKEYKNIDFSLLDITRQSYSKPCDAVFSLDVIEHIPKKLESSYFKNICRSLKPTGICIIGTPNIEAKKYASSASSAGHINLKSYQDFLNFLGTYFVNSFLFSMNDEIVHTGYYPMAHYLLGMGVGVKNK